MPPIEFCIPTTASDKPVALSSYRGKLVLLVLEGLAQQAQNADLKKELQQRALQHAGIEKKLALVAVAYLGNVPKLARSIALGTVKGVANTLKFPIFLDWDGAAYRACNADLNKSNVLLLGRDGELLWGWQGPVPTDKRQGLFDALEKALAEPLTTAP